jgi:hypothetical protein
LARCGDRRGAGAYLAAPLDWRRDDDDLPVVYLTVRALIQSDSTDGGGSD